MALIQPLRERQIPVIDWEEYLRHIKAEYEGLDVEDLKLVTQFLHLQGQVGDVGMISSDHQAHLFTFFLIQRYHTYFYFGRSRLEATMNLHH